MYQNTTALAPATDLNCASSSAGMVTTSGSLITHHPHGIQFLSAVKSLRPPTMPASIFDVGGSLFQRASPISATGLKRTVADRDESENSSDSEGEVSCLEGDSINPGGLGGGFGDAMMEGISFRDGPRPGKKTKGRVKIKMEFIENKLRRYTTFSKRKTGIMKKAYELSTLTGTQVMLLVASETGHVYTFATRKLQPMITSESGKALIQTCLNSPDCQPGCAVNSPLNKSDQRMNPTGFEEPDLSYAVSDEEIANQAYISKQCSKVQGQLLSPDTEPLSLTVHSSSIYRPPPVSNTNFPPSSRPRILASVSTELLNMAAATSRLNVLKQEPRSGYTPSSFLNPMNLVRPKDSPTYNQALGNNVAEAKPVISSTSLVHQLPLTSDVRNQGQTFYTIPGTKHIISLPGGSNVPGTVVYQTPQGLVYATPTKGVDSLSEGGYILNLPQTPTLTEPKNGSAQQFISIPVPVSMALNSQIFRTLMAQQQQQAIKSEIMPTDLRFKVLDSNKQ